MTQNSFMDAETYDLELEKVCKLINENSFKKVCIQLPDGLEPRAGDIKDSIEKNTKAQCLIWLGSCFGACDVPFQVQDVGVDFIIQWGHSEWEYSSTHLNQA